MFQAYLHTCHPIERRLIKLYKLINNITNYKLVSEREIIYFLNNIKKKKKGCLAICIISMENAIYQK